MVYNTYRTWLDADFIVDDDRAIRYAYNCIFIELKLFTKSIDWIKYIVAYLRLIVR